MKRRTLAIHKHLQMLPGISGLQEFQVELIELVGAQAPVDRPFAKLIQWSGPQDVAVLIEASAVAPLGVGKIVSGRRFLIADLLLIQSENSSSRNAAAPELLKAMEAGCGESLLGLHEGQIKLANRSVNDIFIEGNSVQNGTYLATHKPRE